MADLQPYHFEPERVPNAEDSESENEEVNDFAIDLFCLLIVFPQCGSCDDTQESIFFERWVFSCSVQTSYVSSHDLFWENKIVKQKRSIG